MIRNDEGGSITMKRANQVLALILVLAVLLPFATLLIPAPEHVALGVAVRDFRMGLAGCVFFAWLYVGAAILFVIGLDVFKEKLRRAYAAICVGLVLYAIASVQVPLLVATGTLDGSWALHGGLVAPFALGAAMMFIGLRYFAQALEDKSVWTSMWAVFSVTIMLSVLFAWLARDWSQLTFGNISFGANVANVCLGSVSLVLAVHIRRLAGPAYRNALTWLVLAFAATWLGQFPSTIFELFDIPESAILALPVVITAALFVKAGYAFNKIREF